jgi:hypothetical protein
MTIDNITDLYARLIDAANKHPDMAARDIAALVVRQVRATRAMLITLMTPHVEDFQRSRARAIEEDARRRGGESSSDTDDDDETETAEPDTGKSKIEIDDAMLARFQRLYDDPALWTLPGTGPPYYHANPDGVRWFDDDTDQAFRDWCETTYGTGSFDGWLDRAILMIGDTDDPEDWVNFEYHWVPSYLREYALEISFRREIDAALQEYADHIRFEVTAELLDTVFATGDGTRVSWREATVAQHEDRIDMLTKMIAGTSETAAMHMRAVEMIKDAGVDCLGQIGAADDED